MNTSLRQFITETATMLEDMIKKYQALKELDNRMLEINPELLQAVGDQEIRIKFAGLIMDIVMAGGNDASDGW